MNFKDTTPPDQTDEVSFEVELAHPPQKVWRALTEPELIGQWLLSVAEMQLEEGAAFRLQAPPQPGWDGTVQGRFLEIQPHSRLRYAWVVGDIDTEVTFTLTPVDAGTHLAIVQSGFREDQKRNFGGARYGWRMMGDKLVDVLGRLS